MKIFFFASLLHDGSHGKELRRRGVFAAPPVELDALSIVFLHRGRHTSAYMANMTYIFTRPSISMI